MILWVMEYANSLIDRLAYPWVTRSSERIPLTAIVLMCMYVVQNGQWNSNVHNAERVFSRMKQHVIREDLEVLD